MGRNNFRCVGYYYSQSIIYYYDGEQKIIISDHGHTTKLVANILNVEIRLTLAEITSIFETY
jgi:hypothetical protein